MESFHRDFFVNIWSALKLIHNDGTSSCPEGVGRVSKLDSAVYNYAHVAFLTQKGDFLFNIIDEGIGEGYCDSLAIRTLHQCVKDIVCLVFCDQFTGFGMICFTNTRIQ